MKLRYQTAIATLIQFITMTLLNVGTATVSVVTTCKPGNNDCISNLIVSMLYFLLLAAWFGAIWVLGIATQQLRSRRLALLLIAGESAILLVAAFNALHHTDILGLLTSLIDIALALWVIFLASRLVFANGGRIVTKHTVRKARVRPSSSRATRRHPDEPSKDRRLP